MIASAQPMAGGAHLAFRRVGEATVLETSLAASPLRILTPRNHGCARWVFLANFGGGLVDGDCLDVRLRCDRGAFAMLGTQSSTKVYRSLRGCTQRLNATLAEGAALAVIPDPVACFAGARYQQETAVALDAGASLFLFDAYTSGRSAAGERWQFDGYAARTRVIREGRPLFVDSTRLQPVHGHLAERMGNFDVVLSAFAVGPRFARLLAPLLAAVTELPTCETLIVTASPVGQDGVVVRVAAHRFEVATRALRPSFQALAQVLGDDPFARKW